jgi:hypothetical protein
VQPFSMESSAALVVSDDKFKGLLAGGLTVMVCTFLLFDNQPHSLADRWSLGCPNAESMPCSH